jgi:DNA invertase Pin-like site-specific DNA recombinase
MKIALYTHVSKSETHQNVERQLKELREHTEACVYEIIEEIKENFQT